MSPSDSDKPKETSASSIDLRPRENPLLSGLPDYLKDRKNYDKIKKALYDTLTCTKSHAELVEMAECAKCSEDMIGRRLLLRKLGFKNPAQFKAWQKVHETIKKRYPLEKYNT